MFESVHAQLGGGWAGKDTNVCTYNCNVGPAFLTWNTLGGYMHTSVPAPSEKWRDAHSSVHAQSERDRNIGVRKKWGAAHLSMHAQFRSWKDASEWRYKQSERWGQFKLRNPPNATLPPELHSRRPWTPQPRRSCGAQGRFGGLQVHGGADMWRDSLAAQCRCISKIVCVIVSCQFIDFAW